MARIGSLVLPFLLLLAAAGCSFLERGSAESAGAMSLDMKEWTWIRTLYNNDTTVVPAKADAFTLSFSSDGRVNATTDCNQMMGGYTVEGNKLSFSQFASTRMYCADSQEDQFAGMLANVVSFLFTPRGELVLELKFDSGHILLK